MEPHIIILNTIFILEQLLACFLNGLSIIAILKSKTLRTKFNNLILNFLFISHFINGIVGIVTTVLLTEQLPVNVINSLFVTRDFCYILAFCFTVLLSIDRYIAVRFPFFYQTLSKKYQISSVFVIILFNVVFTVWRGFSKSAFIFLMAFTTIGIRIANIANILLFRSVKRQCSAIAATIVLDNTSTQHNRQQQQRNATMRRSLKSLKLCIIVASSLLLVVMPTFVQPSLIKKFVGKKTSDDKTTDKGISMFITIVASSNGLWDVLIFLFINSEARKKVLNLISRIRVGRVTTVPNNNTVPSPRV